MATVMSVDSMKKHGWSDLPLRPYQLEGVNWLLGCHGNGHGCILGDEMGLGKTCQTIAMLTWLTGTSGNERPHLVVCPRSLLENWMQEFSRFAPGLKTMAYVGDKDERADLSKKMKKSKKGLQCCFDVLVTTYELCLKDFLFLQSVSWHMLVVDEAHRLKNSESLLYCTLEQWDFDCRVLLTGTPVQNNLQELHALLAFIHSKQFKPSGCHSFVQKYTDASKKEMEELHSVLKPYLLRRMKANVLKDLPDKSDVVLYHGLSPLQKKLYKAILTKDLEAFENSYNTGQTRLMNILMQLRKCVNHPYLFDGVEPEPFELGEHLVEASAKLMLIDRLLKCLHALGHKVLLFSQMTHMLDVLQDYLGYRGFTYERLDGSVRGEERFLAVQNFNLNDETFVFLLSTKAGGQGLNLTAADTVIFVDSDFNPQNDLQAAARAHRIGQNRSVKVIRLIGKNTVEEIILKRAEEKLKLTDSVIEKGEFDTVASYVSKQVLASKPGQLQDILKFGVDKLLNDETAEEDLDFSIILGASVNGEWQVDGGREAEKDEEEKSENGLEKEEGEVPQTMYVFEGHDYSKDIRDTSAEDRDAFKTFVALEKASKEESSLGERTMRRQGATVIAGLLPEPVRKPRKPEELESQRKKRQEAAEKRAKKAAEEKERKRIELWKKHMYTSANIALDSEGEEEEEEDELEDEEGRGDEEEGGRGGKSIHYVMGDVTHPVDTKTANNIIVHCADDSGYWGRGGLFTAIASRSGQPQKQYELAGKAKDLTLGDCHLIPMDDVEEGEEGRDLLALIIAQTRDRKNKLSGIKLTALREGLERVYQKAQHLKASVHLPRIGHDTPGFNWYGTERLIHKILASKGMPTYIYYYPRKQTKRKQTSLPSPPPAKAAKTATATSNSVCKPSTSTANATNIVSSTGPLDLFSGIAVHLYNVESDAMIQYKRFIIAYDGDVDSYVHGSTTHLITSATTDVEDLKKVRGGHKCCVVTTHWLDDCLKQNKILMTEAYTIDL